MQNIIDINLLKTLCSIHGPSGDEGLIRDFLLDYVSSHSSKWKVKPRVLSGEGWQNNIVLVFGEPRTAVFAHIDTIGFMVRYEDQLVPIGGPEIADGFRLSGSDRFGPVECELKVIDDHAKYKFGRPIQTGTTLTWTPDFRQFGDFVQSGYMDNRLGVYNALKLAETLENGAIVFSTWEEHGGGAIPYIVKYLYEILNIKAALISDITWVTDGVVSGDGVVISLRDRNIPRKEFTDKIVRLAEKSRIPFQLEVEAGGSSDGREVQVSPYPIDWCFIGAPEENVHSPHEKVHVDDILSMGEMYKFLMKNL
ncbi:MAG: aminopeptidase [Cyclobacteriaceae bacterium]|nr:aminopeptidase [Cyclobacteriaceae bacterium]